ncbi:MAG: histidinol-phosphate transaminase [Bacillati bacterium ANGP1]|uniref:Histidinol-phosphate aminotransferase n=1 Tax=Candidatus Segetimicrobium genomatis TaxID=2569760 RepID=A0A537JIK5_9BACT|nr:MAG: histidinol-phosphate transaminase [Terrabacteria group bacterium ANGP1]
MTQPRPRARRALAALEPYIPGRSAEEVMARFGLTQVVKLGSNENPLGVSPRVREAVIRTLDRAHHYPDGESTRLRARLAERFGRTPEHFCVANGADNILTCLGLAFVERGDRCVTGLPTYTAYAGLVRLLEGELVEVPLREWTFDVRALAEAAAGAKAVIVCNPNNPTGSILRHDELQALAERVPPDVLLVVDEAYAEWVDDPAFPDSVALLRRHPNIVIVRTFSKIYGLAGLRVGYAIGAPEIVASLIQVREPFPVDRLAQAAAEAALDDEAYVRAAYENNRVGKAALAKGLAALGLRPLPSQANFVLVDLGRPAAAVAERLLERGVIIRPGGLWRLPTWARITVGTPQEITRMLEALSAVLRQPA